MTAIDGYKFFLWFPNQKEPTEFVQRDMTRANLTVDRLLADQSAGKCDVIANQDGPLVVYEAVYHNDETED